jgi:hypothetical protein
LSAPLTDAIGLDLGSSPSGTTLLVGRDIDQARLHSVFGMLQDLNIELISVSELPPNGCVLN